jgi:hypothetical protein
MKIKVSIEPQEDHRPTCEDRIDAELELELERIRQAQAWQRISDKGEDKLEEIEEEVGVTPDDSWDKETVDDYIEGILEATALHTVYRVGLSWGGPADGFLVYVDPKDKTIDKIEYYFQDWFDEATRALSGSSFDLVEEIILQVLILK